jgi:phospholipase C
MSTSSNNESTGESSAVGNIKHVIVLMFENRSFDHILGAMPGVDGVLDSQGNVLPELYNTMNPTTAPGEDNPATTPAVIVPASNPDPPLPSESQLITHDFTHDFGDGMLQDLFGPGTTGVIEGQPQNNPPVTYPAINSGFLSTIAYAVSGQPPNGAGALSYFKWGSMEVLHKLAKSFLVCDAWHCDMPGHTSPNRAFMHCATTGDLGINDNDAVGSTRMVNRTTIFERIQDTNQTWKMYSPNLHLDTNWLNEQVLSQQYNPQQPTAFNVTNVPIENFFNDLENGTLPFYSFIMCWSDGQDTSMHPASEVEAAENMLACVYNALQSSSYWTDTLLIVNFDENGGMYDHRSVPQTIPPDDDPSGSQQPPISTWYSKYTDQTYSFDFSVLGVRIPVILISPWLNAGVCGTQYQNTSILRFLQDLLPNANLNDPYYLTQRDLNAPTIAPVFEYEQFGSPQARTDCPSNIEGYGGSDVCSEFQTAVTPDAAALAAPPAPHIEKITREYFAALPGHPDSGKPLARSFATVAELRAYAGERLEAALAYIREQKLRP